MVRFWYIFYVIYVSNIYAVTYSGSNLSNFTDSVVNIESSKSQIALNNQSISIYFDSILDENITKSEPRIKSIIYTALILKNSIVFIEYSNFNSISLAEKIAQIIKSENITVYNPKLLSSRDFFEKDIFEKEFSTLVRVYIKYIDDK